MIITPVSDRRGDRRVRPAGAAWRTLRLWPAMPATDTPVVGARYWTALCVASVAGCNLGDFLSLYLHMGHVTGLIPIGLVLALLLGIERFVGLRGEGWYWTVVLVLRAAATNVADMLSHAPFNLDYSWILAGLEAVQVLFVLPVASSFAAPGKIVRPVADGWYWLCLLTAGALGTAIGDCTAERFGLGTGWGTLVLSASAALLLFVGGRMGWRSKAGYWLAILAIRAAGTTAGDWFAFGDGGLNLGLPLSTALTCAVFLLILVLWRPKRRAAEAVV